MDFARDAQTICNRRRGFQPWPGSFTTFRGKQLTLHAIEARATGPRLAPGEIAVEGDAILAGCGNGTVLVIHELQLEGKRRMTAREFVNGYQLKPAEKLGA